MELENSNNNSLSMNWYKIFSYFVCPIFFVALLLNLPFTYNLLDMTIPLVYIIFLFDIFTLILNSFTIYMLVTKRKNAPTIVMIFIAVKCIIFIFNNVTTLNNTQEILTRVLLYTLILGSLCFYPNLIYFEKRVNFFNK